MAGETDLASMLSGLSVTRRPGVFTVVTRPASEVASLTVGAGGIEALMDETEGVTVVATVDAAAERGWSGDFEAAWLTLDVHSALEAVGLTAAFSAALGEQGIPCNVLAGYFHDHLLVPVDRADAAIAALEALRG